MQATVEYKDISDFVRRSFNKNANVKIKAELFPLFNSAGYLRSLAKSAIISICSTGNIHQSESMLSAYVIMIGSRDFELVDKFIQSTSVEYVFRKIPAATENFIPAAQVKPYRYILVDKINDYLIRLGIQARLKKILMKFFGA